MSSSSLLASFGIAIHNFYIPRSSLRVPVSIHLVFESELSSRLEQLNLTNERGFLSIKWLSEALEIVLCTHSSAETLISDLDHDVLFGDGKWINGFLDNTIKLLDTCVILKAAIAEIKMYCGQLKVALRAVDKEPTSEIQLKRCMKALKNCMDALKRRNDAINHLGHRRSKLENCSSILRRMVERLITEDATNGNVFTAIFAAQMITISVCSLLSSALSFKPKRSLSFNGLMGQSLWSLPLCNLQHRVKEQIEKKKSRGSYVFLEELDATDIAVRNFYNLIEQSLHAMPSSDTEFPISKVKESAKVMQTLLRELEQGISTVECRVENIQRNLLKSRMGFLHMERSF
ncbi:hypothetical protein KP509_22G029100 [Ceratopteris richardii]|uniref:Uncharacterized protein n=1 Tax=Ceratopteris richardii TaxID=49495 RepID=A0A8T2S4N8_CERRI|nr:hypothetical protein KP509_22G029100 [Ceratopteris richardii]